MLCIIETHPIQYHAPVWRCIEKDLGIPVTVIYGSDFSTSGYFDKEFGVNFAWKENLLSGYTTKFLSTVAKGGAKDVNEVHSKGLDTLLRDPAFKAILLVGYSPKFHWDAFKFARKTGLPILFRAETTDHAQKRSWLKSVLRDLKLRWLYSQCSALLPVGIRSRNHYDRLGFADKAKHFSPYCVDLAPFRTLESDRVEMRSTTRESFGISEDAFVVMYCGKLSHRKGVDLLLDALAAIKLSVDREFFLILAGDGDMKAELSNKASKTNGLKLIVTGFKQQHELSAFYHASDVFCLPSRIGETWGLVVNEALHHGIECICSESVGSWIDLLDNRVNGQKFKSNNLLDLKEKLINSYSYKSVDTFDLRNKRRKFMDKYSVRNAANGIGQAYQEILKIGL